MDRLLFFGTSRQGSVGTTGNAEHEFIYRGGRFIVVFTDHSVAQSYVPEQDARVFFAAETHGVPLQMIATQWGTKCDPSALITKEQSDARVGRIQTVGGVLFALAVPALWVLNTLRKEWKGDLVDRANIRSFQNKQKQKLKEMEKQDIIDLQILQLIQDGKSKRDVTAELQLAGETFDPVFVEEMFQLKREGNLPNISAEDIRDMNTDINVSMISMDAVEEVEEEKGMGERLDELDAAKKRLESQAGARRDMSEAEKKLLTKIRNSRMRRISVKMRERGLRFQQMEESTLQFSDVAGLPDAVNALREIVDFFHNAEYWKRAGARVPKGVLLYGPPGNGKTLMARATAGESGVAFLSLNASEFIEMFQGVGAARVKALFGIARQLAPCIIFIDEIDALGRKRGGTSGNDERDQALNQLLTEMDGFATTQNVVVMGATNRLDVLDEALVRPGRFDRHIKVELPNLESREAIFEVHGSKRPLAADVDYGVLARSSSGLSGAEIADVVNRAAFEAGRAGEKQITMGDFSRALTLELDGEQLLVKESTRKRLATQAAALSVVMSVHPDTQRLSKAGVCVFQKRKVPGVFSEESNEILDTDILTAAQIRGIMASCLAGYVGEQLVYGKGDMSTMNLPYLHYARTVASHLVLNMGFSVASDKLPPAPLTMQVMEKMSNADIVLGPRNLFHLPDSVSEDQYEEASRVMKAELARAEEAARALLTRNRAALDALVATFMERDELDGEEVREVLRAHVTAEDAAAMAAKKVSQTSVR